MLRSRLWLFLCRLVFQPHHQHVGQWHCHICTYDTTCIMWYMHIYTDTTLFYFSSLYFKVVVHNQKHSFVLSENQPTELAFCFINFQFYPPPSSPPWHIASMSSDRFGVVRAWHGVVEQSPGGGSVASSDWYDKDPWMAKNDWVSHWIRKTRLIPVTVYNMIHSTQ